MEFIVKPYNVAVYNEAGDKKAEFDLIDFMMHVERISAGWTRKGAEYMPEVAAFLEKLGFSSPTIAEAWQVVRHCSKLWGEVKKNIDASLLQSTPLDSIL